MHARVYQDAGEKGPSPKSVMVFGRVSILSDFYAHRIDGFAYAMILKAVRIWMVKRGGLTEDCFPIQYDISVFYRV